MSKHIGILTAGGDSPGLNAAIRGVGKAALNEYDMQVIGFRDGFRGLVENRNLRLESGSLSGILTVGGTILGTSNKADPSNFAVRKDEDGNHKYPGSWIGMAPPLDETRTEIGLETTLSILRSVAHHSQR